MKCFKENQIEYHARQSPKCFSRPRAGDQFPLGEIVNFVWTQSDIALMAWDNLPMASTSGRTREWALLVYGDLHFGRKSLIPFLLLLATGSQERCDPSDKSCHKAFDAFFEDWVYSHIIDFPRCWRQSLEFNYCALFNDTEIWRAARVEHHRAWLPNLQSCFQAAWYVRTS